MNADHTQEGVMDSLFEALQTGSAFSRDQRRRRQGGTNTGGNKYYLYLLINIKQNIIHNYNYYLICIPLYFMFV